MVRKVLDMQLPGKRKLGRLQRRYLDVVKEDMRKVGAREDEVFTQNVWRGSGRGLVVRVLVGLRTLGSWVRSPHRAWFAFET